MADPTKAWHAVFDKGSKQAQERLKKAHGSKPEFQAFLKSRGAEGGERSVTQASTSLKKATGAKVAAQKIADMRYKKALQASSERVKEMGRRRRESGEGLGGGLESNKDIIAHVKQHGSIKAGRLGEAVKPDASMAMTDELKRKMITDKDKQTLGKIATLMSSQKNKNNKKTSGGSNRFEEVQNEVVLAIPKADVVTDTRTNKEKKNEYIRQLGLKAMQAGKVDPARGHIPTRAGRETMKEGFDPSPAEIAKMLVDKHGPNVTKDHIKELENERDTHGGLDHEEIMKHVKKMTEEVESVDEANMRFDYEAAARPKSSDVKNFLNRNKNARAAAASKKYIRRMTKLGGLGPNQTKKDTEAHMKAHFEEVVIEGAKEDAEKLLGGPVKTRTGNEPKGKLPLGFRQARNLARQAMKAGKSVTEASEYTSIGHPPEHSMDVDPKKGEMPSAEKRKRPAQYKPGKKDGVNIKESKEENAMSRGKTLAKMIMAKQSKHPITQNMGEEVEQISEAASADAKAKAKKQIIAMYGPGHITHSTTSNGGHFIQHEDDIGDTHSHQYHPKTGKVDLASVTRSSYYGEEVEQISEKDDREYDYEGDMAKSQLKSIISNAQKLHDMLEDTTNLPEWVQSKITLAEDYVVTAANYCSTDLEEEVEQVDEKYMGFKKVMAAAKAGGARNPAAVAAAIGRKKYGKEKFQAMAAAGKRHANEEVEQIDEQSPAEIKAKYYHDQFDKVKPVKAYDKEGKLVGHYRSMAHAKQMKPGHTYKMAEEVVTEAEGSVPTTPKEKELAAHHGDPNRITFGDVLKARLKSAAAKKMGK